ncbi:unnamed protein product, partial [Aureobasidium pullulans]
MCRVSNCRMGKVTLLPSTNKTETRPAKRGFHFAWPKEEDITQARHHHREKSLKKKPSHTSISCGLVTMSNHVQTPAATPGVLRTGAMHNISSIGEAVHGEALTITLSVEATFSNAKILRSYSYRRDRA